MQNTNDKTGNFFMSLTVYTTIDTQTKFERTRIKNGKVHIFIYTIYSIYI